MEDAAIVALYWQRDEGAICASEEKYGPTCRKLSYQILQSIQDAEECTNDTWHRAWDTMPPQRPQSLRAYLLRIVRNLSIDRWRTRRSKKRGEGLEELVLELEECVATAPSAEAVWEGEAVAEVIDCWLDTLEEMDRAAFLLRYWYGQPVKELARRFGGSANGMSKRLHRLRQSLRQTLEREGVKV
ncbi:MAG: RNA polymerase sigma factor [Lawsonibacter sp.]